MKRTINIRLTLVFIISLISIFPSIVIIGQDAPADVGIEFTTWKYSDGSRELIAKLTGSNDEGDYPVAGQLVNFFTSNETEMSEIGIAKTGDDGKAILKINNSIRLMKNAEGYLHFLAKSDGNDKVNAAEAELKVKDARLELDFTLVDSVRTVEYHGYVTNSEGSEEPLMDQDVYLYVPRMFSLLKIQDGWLESSGEGTIEFPSDLVGDSAGVVKILARVEDHPDYGNLEASAMIDWGLKKHSEKFEGPQRELWTPIAPLWMIITLIIMLSGVWGHYFYAVIQLIKIKQAGKKTSSS